MLQNNPSKAVAAELRIIIHGLETAQVKHDGLPVLPTCVCLMSTRSVTLFKLLCTSGKVAKSLPA